MKILVNGNTISEIACEKAVRVRENRKLKGEDLELANKMLAHIKRNKKMYFKLVVITALMLHYDMNFVHASSLENSLDSVGNKLVGMLMSVAKWGCMGMGLRNMVITLLNGGNMKNAMSEGIQYCLGYLFIEFYPQLFDLFSGIKF